MKELLKKTLFDCRKKYHLMACDFNDRRLATKSKEPIPKLSKKEKKEIKDYWAQYGYTVHSTESLRFYYAKTGIHDCRFVPTGIFFHEIIPRLNRMDLTRAWEDKAFLSQRLEGLAIPEQILTNVNGIFYDKEGTFISQTEADRVLQACPEIIVKPTLDSGTGKGLSLFSHPLSVQELLDRYHQDFIVQRPIHQSATTAAFNASSVNCIRINSLFWKGTVRILSAFMHIGEEGEIADNRGKKWYLIAINPDGTLKATGFDASYQKKTQTASGLCFKGLTVPGFDKAKTLIKTAHLRYPYFKVIGWDVCLDQNDNPMIIEANLETPGVGYPQLVCGPFFGDMTDEILDELKDQQPL